MNDIYVYIRNRILEEAPGTLRLSLELERCVCSFEHDCKIDLLLLLLLLLLVTLLVVMTLHYLTL